MKWFKHISDSLQDPLIIHLVNEFGPLGYMVFFGVLEKYGREFKIDPGWKLRVKLEFFRGSFQQKQKKNIKNILNFLQSSRKWSVKFSGNPLSDKEEVEIQIPKFEELLDESTKKKMRFHSGINPEKIRIYPPIEEEEEEDNIINNPPIVPPSGDCEIQEKNEIFELQAQGQNQPRPEAKKQIVPVDEIVALYHEILPELPRVIKITPERKKTITSRWDEDKERQSLNWWSGYFESVRSQDFLMGKNDRGFKANLDFLMTKSKMTKVEEGQYGNSGGKSTSRKDNAFRDAYLNLANMGEKHGKHGICDRNGEIVGDVRPGSIRGGCGANQEPHLSPGVRLLPGPGSGNGRGYAPLELETDDLGTFSLPGNGSGSDACGGPGPEIQGGSGREKVDSGKP